MICRASPTKHARCPTAFRTSQFPCSRDFLGSQCASAYGTSTNAHAMHCLPFTNTSISSNDSRIDGSCICRAGLRRYRSLLLVLPHTGARPTTVAGLREVIASAACWIGSSAGKRGNYTAILRPRLACIACTHMRVHRLYVRALLIWSRLPPHYLLNEVKACTKCKKRSSFNAMECTNCPLLCYTKVPARV